MLISENAFANTSAFPHSIVSNMLVTFTEMFLILCSLLIPFIFLAMRYTVSGHPSLGCRTFYTVY